MRLETASVPAALIDAVCDALPSAEPSVGWEISDTDRSHHRALIQFPVHPNLFDWFFNARTGYRAHFRAHPDCGLAFNADVVCAVRDRLRGCLPSIIRAVKVDSAMSAQGEVSISNADLVRSLDPALAKFWVGATAIGGADRGLGASGPKICVGSDRWPALYMVGHTWLDLKGAFDDNGKLYQPKSPRGRAIKLHETGRA